MEASKLTVSGPLPRGADLAAVPAHASMRPAMEDSEEDRLRVMVEVMVGRGRSQREIERALRRGFCDPRR
jgi:hypothetical protein